MKDYDLASLESKDPHIKYGMQKRILELSASHPETLYPDFDYFVSLLDSSNSILLWTGILVIGNMARIDRDHKMDPVLPQLVSMLNTGKMITAGNTIKALTEIIKARPVLADSLAREILKVKNDHYDTQECDNIAIGHALNHLEQVWDLLSGDVQGEVIQFARGELHNSRPATVKKAEKLLKKHVSGSLQQAVT